MLVLQTVLLPLNGEGDSGVEDREKRGQDMDRRREKRGGEAGFPRWQEVGKGRFMQHCTIFCGDWDQRVREAGGLNPPVPPPHLMVNFFTGFDIC